MSIITDALKKADHQKKWKITRRPEPDEHAKTGVLEAPIPVQKEASPQVVFPKTTPVHIEASQTKKTSSSTPILKIVFIVFLSCLFFIVIAGPWLYMWVKSWNEPPVVISPPATAVQPATATPVKKGYMPYLNPGAAQTVAIAPAPRSLKNLSLEQQYQLTGTSVVGSQRYALINSQLSEVGAKIDGAEVIAIGNQEATLKKDNKEFTIRLR